MPGQLGPATQAGMLAGVMPARETTVVPTVSKKSSNCASVQASWTLLCHCGVGRQRALTSTPRLDCWPTGMTLVRSLGSVIDRFLRTMSYSATLTSPRRLSKLALLPSSN